MQGAKILLFVVLGGLLGFLASQYAGRDTTKADQHENNVAGSNLQLSDLGIDSISSLENLISSGVSKFLEEKPEAVVAALEKFQENQAKIAEEDRVKLLRSLNDPLFSQLTDPSIGATASEADVSIVEFFDYRCGYCRRAHSSIVELIKTDSKIRVVMKEFPILGPDSVSAAMISLSANMINSEKYADLHDRLIKHQGPYDEATLLALAADVGYDPAGIQAAMTNKALTAQIENARQIAEALNIRGTPAFIIGDKIIPGAVPLQQLRVAIEEARTRAEKRLVN
jgi:protein-disulfide isomerase